VRGQRSFAFRPAPDKAPARASVHRSAAPAQLRSLAPARSVAFTMSPNQSSEIARINGELLVALAEAQRKLATNEIDAELVDLIRHAREHYVLLSEALLAAEPDIDPRVRGLGATMGERIALLVAAVEGIEGSDGRLLD
jgi:hypothetical protein